MDLYYDAVLVSIPVVLLGTAGGLVASGVGFTGALSAATVIPTVLIGHAMFVNGPDDGVQGEMRTRAPRSEES